MSLREAYTHQPANMSSLDGWMGREHPRKISDSLSYCISSKSQLVSSYARLKALVLELLNCEGHIFQGTWEDRWEVNASTSTFQDCIGLLVYSPND